MTLIHNDSMSPKWAYAVCLFLGAVAFLSFAWCLDRFPGFHIDEPFFNASAARFVEGEKFVYVTFTQAPHGTSVFAQHGPFFSNLQILTFTLLGVEHFACRLPGYIGGHLAILLLCLFCLQRKHTAAAVLVAVTWIGDRSLLVLRYGRPDGLALLCLVCTYIFLVRACETLEARPERSSSLLFLAGVCLGTAVGFHPGALYAVLCCGVTVLVIAPRRTCLRIIVTVVAGGTVPLFLWLYCWYPNLQESMEQFLWSIQYRVDLRDYGMFENICRDLRLWPLHSWAQYWHAALIAAIVGVLIPWTVTLGVSLKLVRRNRLFCRDGEIAAVLASSMAAGGLLLLSRSLMCDYYYLFITVWPVVAVMFFLGTAQDASRWRKSIMLSVVGVMMVAWLPSLGWNIMRFRESILWYKVLDRRPMVEDLKKTIPLGANVMGYPSYFIVAQKAGLKFTPLAWSWTDPGMARGADENSWLVLSYGVREILKSQDAAFFDNRRLYLESTVFGASPYLTHEYFVYGPDRKNL